LVVSIGELNFWVFLGDYKVFELVWLFFFIDLSDLF